MPMHSDAEVLRLRRVLRDLVALSAIPSAWVGKAPPAVASGLVDVLATSLRLDFVFVRLCDPNGGAAVEITHGDSRPAFRGWLQDHLAEGIGSSRAETFPG